MNTSWVNRDGMYPWKFVDVTPVIEHHLGLSAFKGNTPFHPWLMMGHTYGHTFWGIDHPSHTVCHVDLSENLGYPQRGL